MLPSVLPTETDHVPVLADEVLDRARAAAGRDGRRLHVRRRRPLGAARRASARRGQADRDRPRPDRRAVLRAAAPVDRGQGAAAPRRVLAGARRSSRANGVRADAILLDLGVSSMQLDRPERGFSYAADAPLDMRMDPSADLTAADVVNETGEWELADIFRRYGEERYARQIARAIVRRRRKQPFERTGDLVEMIKQAIPGAGALRRGASGEARLPGAPDRGQRRARRARARAAGRARDAAAARPARGDLVPLARGPDRQAVPARRRARLHLPARLPGLRVRLDADAARDSPAGDPAERGRGRPQPALRSRRACAWR